MKTAYNQNQKLFFRIVTLRNRRSVEVTVNIKNKEETLILVKGNVEQNNQNKKDENKKK